MPSSTHPIFEIYELVEHIILQLEHIPEIIQAQRVCRKWRDVIHSSPPLHEACWYQYCERDKDKVPEQPTDSKTRWKLNPVFNRLDVSIKNCPWILQENPVECGDFSLRTRIYDKPGSWTTMLATQPPCQHMVVECFGNYSGDETMYYIITSTAGPLLLGDVMAILAEGQNRQEYGEDRWAGVIHEKGSLHPFKDELDDDFPEVRLMLQGMPEFDNGSIRVVVDQAWGSGTFPAFSLRRVSPDLGKCYFTGDGDFLHELIVHKMEFGGSVYIWDWWSHSREKHSPVVKTRRPYEANLVAVREIQEGYLEECRDIFRLLPGS